MESISTDSHSDVARIAKRGLARFFSIRTMVSTTAALLVAVALATVAAGGTYAMWNQSAAITSGATIRSGTAELAVTSALVMPSTRLYPGLSIHAPVSLQNTGNVPLQLRVSSLVAPSAASTFSQSIVIGFALAPSSAACSAGSIAPTWTGTFASHSSTAFGAPIAAGSAAVLCVSVALPTTAPNGGQNQTAANFGGIIDSVQV